MPKYLTEEQARSIGIDTDMSDEELGYGGWERVSRTPPTSPDWEWPEVGGASSEDVDDDAPPTGCAVAALALLGGGLAVLAGVGYEVVRWLV